MRVSIPGIEKKAYFDSYFDSLGKGTDVHSVLLTNFRDTTTKE